LWYLQITTWESILGVALGAVRGRVVTRNDLDGFLGVQLGVIAEVSN
jgi:hypothetical protein